jgi:hypothetical protein
MLKEKLERINKWKLEEVQTSYEKKLAKLETKAEELSIDIEAMKGILDTINQITNERLEKSRKAEEENWANFEKIAEQTYDFQEALKEHGFNDVYEYEDDYLKRFQKIKDEQFKANHHCRLPYLERSSSIEEYIHLIGYNEETDCEQAYFHKLNVEFNDYQYETYEAEQHINDLQRLIEAEIEADIQRKEI